MQSRRCKVNLSGGWVRTSEKSDVFPQLSEPALLCTRKIKGKENKLLSTVLNGQSRHFLFELTGCELYW